MIVLRNYGMWVNFASLEMIDVYLL